VNRKTLAAFTWAAAFLLGCTQPDKTKQTAAPQHQPAPAWQAPPAGTKVAEIRERIQQDRLNRLYFSVQVISTEDSKTGLYKVALTYGYGKRETTVQLPKWTDSIALKPALKKGKEEQTILLGFEAGDTTFHPYYEITVENKAIKMNQVRTYYITKE